jgi:hypothetical protein
MTHMARRSDANSVFSEARAVLDHLLDMLERRAGDDHCLHLTGCPGLGDGRPGQSHVHIVLVRGDTARNAQPMAALGPICAGRAHARPSTVSCWMLPISKPADGTQ